MIEVTSIREAPELISDFYGHMPESLALEFDVMPINEFHFYRTLFPTQKHVDGSPLIHRVRMIKSEWEIARMEETAERSSKTFEHMKKNIRPGISEMEFAGMYETFARRLGHGGKLRVRDYQTEGYPWHILSGKSGGMVGLLDSPASGEGTSLPIPAGEGVNFWPPTNPL